MKLSTLFGKPKPKLSMPKETATLSGLVEDSAPYWMGKARLIYMKLSDSTNTLEADEIKTLRVQVDKDGFVSVTSFDLLGHPLEGSYASVDCLPNRVQEKIAILMMGGEESMGDEVKDIGLRVAESTFWVYDLDGDIND